MILSTLLKRATFSLIKRSALGIDILRKLEGLLLSLEHLTSLCARSWGGVGVDHYHFRSRYALFHMLLLGLYLLCIPVGIHSDFAHYTFVRQNVSQSWELILPGNGLLNIDELRLDASSTLSKLRHLTLWNFIYLILRNSNCIVILMKLR